MKSIWKSVALEGILLVLLVFDSAVESVVTTEWSITEEYTMAWLNVTYINPTNNKLHSENLEIGKYGTGRVLPAAGVVVHVKSLSSSDGKINHFGCEPFSNSNIPPNGPWIALIKRGNCNFDTKLQNAQAKKATAMVVYNDSEQRDNLEKMGLSNCRNCTIPGIFTTKEIGEGIASIVDQGTRVDMYITVGETCTRPYSGINRTSVLFVSISFIVLMIISLAWLVFYYVQRFRYLHAKDRLAQRLCNAAKKALAKIPTRNIKMTDKELSGEAECCAVCIEVYASGDILRTLPCRHEFHKGCVDPWLLEHRTCPMCKMDILKYYGYIFTGSQESILHLDMEDAIMNSSESRDTDSPIHDPHNQTQIIRFPDQITDHHIHHNRHHSTDEAFPQASAAHPTQTLDDSIRKPSLISLTVVAAPRSPTASSGQGCVINVDENCAFPGYKNDDHCKTSCDSSPDEKSSSLPEYHHPMCFVHGDRSIHQSQEISDEHSSTGVTCSHHPLIHREGSGHLSHSSSLDKATSTEKIFVPSHSNESHHSVTQDANTLEKPQEMMDTDNSIPTDISPSASATHQTEVEICKD